MASALVIDNGTDDGIVGASSQEITLPATNLQTPHPSERWRSQNSADWFILDKGASSSGDTVGVFGLTCGDNSTIRLRLSTVDPTGVAGDALDTGTLANGDGHFDVDYGSFVYRMAAPAAYRYARIDLSDPDASYVEAGCLMEGLSEQFAYNFARGSSVQHVDRSRVASTSSGQTLTWDDNTFRRVDLSYDFITRTQRFGMIERLDLVKGRKRNVLLIMEVASDNFARDSIFGLVTDLTPVSFGQANDLFGKQLRIDERI